MIEPEGLYQIGTVAEESGASIDTIRYYEKMGLIKKPVRSEGGFRLYPKQAVEKLRFIKKAQGFGLTLAEIKQIMWRSESGLENCCGYVGKLFEKKLNELEAKMKELRRMRKGLRVMMKTWIPLKEAKKKSYVVCPQIETERPRKGGKRNGKKKN